MQPAAIDPTLDLCTKYLLRTGADRGSVEYEFTRHFYTWPALGIEPQTFLSWVQCPIHWATCSQENRLLNLNRLLNKAEVWLNVLYSVPNLPVPSPNPSASRLTPPSPVPLLANLLHELVLHNVYINQHLIRSNPLHIKPTKLPCHNGIPVSDVNLGLNIFYLISDEKGLSWAKMLYMYDPSPEVNLPLFIHARVKKTCPAPYFPDSKNYSVMRTLFPRTNYVVIFISNLQSGIQLYNSEFSVQCVITNYTISTLHSDVQLHHLKVSLWCACSLCNRVKLECYWRHCVYVILGAPIILMCKVFKEQLQNTCNNYNSCVILFP